MRTPTKRRSRRLISAALMVTALSASAAIADEAKKSLAEAVAQLRDGVESLASDVTFTREERNRRAQAHVQATAQLRADLEAVTLRNALAEKALATLQADAPVDVDDTQLGEALRVALDAAQDAVHVSIPFRKREREAELRRIRQELRGRSVPPVMLAQQFASFLEDEARLNRQSGVAKTEVDIEGEGVLLVDAVRIGMMSLFFRTEDGRYGRAHAGIAGGKATLTHDADVCDGIETLLLRFQKGQKTGHVVLPLSGVQP